MFRAAGIVVRFDREEALEVGAEIGRHLQSKGMKVAYELEAAKLIGMPEAGVEIGRMHVDLIVVVGGDGTLLRTCMGTPNPTTPILGVNMGTGGYLIETTPEEAKRCLDKCLAGEFTIEECMKIRSCSGERGFPDALNEVVFTSATKARLLGFRVSIKDASYEFRADGLIVATPTGSTAYSLSAGGPIVDPEVDALILTPICPLTQARPYIVPAIDGLEVSFVKPKREVEIVIDGAFRQRLNPDVEVSLEKSDLKARLIRMDRKFLAKRVRGRGLFGGD